MHKTHSRRIYAPALFPLHPCRCAFFPYLTCLANSRNCAALWSSPEVAIDIAACSRRITTDRITFPSSIRPDGVA